MTNSTNTVLLLVAVAGVIATFYFLVRVAIRLHPLNSGPMANAVSNARSLSRFRVEYRAEIQVLNREKSPTERARLVDLSDDGARVRFGSSLPMGTPVRFRIHELKSAWTAHVRFCARRGFRYVIGLEFKGPPYRIP